MNTATTLIMITFLGLASAHASATPASGESSLTGMPMSTAKRLLSVPVPSVGSTDVQITGVPMSRATRLLGSQVLTASTGPGAPAVTMRSVSMVHAKRA